MHKAKHLNNRFDHPLGSMENYSAWQKDEPKLKPLLYAVEEISYNPVSERCSEIHVPMVESLDSVEHCFLMEQPLEIVTLVEEPQSCIGPVFHETTVQSSNELVTMEF